LYIWPAPGITAENNTAFFTECIVVSMDIWDESLVPANEKSGRRKQKRKV
jgi:hypothetical protein